MELDTATPSALTMKSLSGERPIQRIGVTTWVTTAVAVLNSMSGKPTRWRMLILLTPARCQVTTVARAASVEMALRGRMEFAIRTAVT
jgi:hypothetical protein